MARKRNLKEWLEFLNIPHHPASDGREIQTTCFYPDCGKEDHLYINAVDYTHYCHHCGQGGGPNDLEKVMLDWVVRTSEGKDGGYWSGRGFTEGTIKRFRLGYYEALDRYTIPYLDADGSVINISLRKRIYTPGDKFKYVRLPRVDSTVFEVRDSGDTGLVVITEGEVDAITVWQSTTGGDRVALILGLPGKDFINDRLVASIPRGARVIAIIDSDAESSRVVPKIRKRIPSATILRPADTKKDCNDVNDVLLNYGEGTVRELLLASPRGEDATSEPDSEGGRPSGVPSTIFVTLPDTQGDWLIKDLWMDQALGFIAGIPKAMKSLMALHIGYHVAEGKPFAGKEIVTPGPVLLFQEEDNDHLIKRRIRNIGDGAGSNNLWLFTPGITNRHLRLDSDDAVEMLDGAIQAIQPVLVILDPLANMHSLEDENNAGQINKILERIRYLRDLRKCAFMIVHHMRKEGDGGGSNPGQKMRGSSVFHAKAESALYIERWGNLLYVHVENKLQAGRKLSLRYTGKEFKFESETGPATEEDAESGQH